VTLLASGFLMHFSKVSILVDGFAGSFDVRLGGVEMYACRSGEEELLPFDSFPIAYGSFSRVAIISY